jgi:DNA-binding CsgD family transcriptional regulator
LFIISSIIIFRAQRFKFNKRHTQAKKDLERARQIEEELKHNLLTKDKEITSYTINFIRKNELLEELGEKIELLKGKLPASSKELNSILNLVQNNNIDKDWEDFKKIFENVHHDFFGKLLMQYPDLSPTELKLCALVYMNLSIKEMASLMGISPDSVKTSRYRLRKKLGLSQEQNLSEFIINYG